MISSVQDAYEALYTGKSYQHEIGLVDVVIDRKLGAAKPGKRLPPRRVLEVGCGPGLRLAVLQQWRGKYEVEGLDRDPAMLALAARRVPGLPLHEADMRDFALESRYDAVLCLFGVIGYMADVDEMVEALTRMREHLLPKGVLLLEPWLTPDLATDRYLRADSARRTDLEVQRMNFTRVRGNKSILSVHYLIGDENGVRHVQEVRELTLFTEAQYREALQRAGYGDVMLEAYGPQGRGLYIAQV
jgi:SAM-dependent methyltransferase